MKERCRNSRWKRSSFPLPALPSPRCRAGVHAPIWHREPNQSSLLPPCPVPAPCCHASQRRGHTVWERKEFPRGDVGREDAAGWTTLLPTSTSPLLGSMPMTSFLLLEGKVWDRQSSHIFLFFHHGKFPGSLSRNRAINPGCPRKELTMQPRLETTSERRCLLVDHQHLH